MASTRTVLALCLVLQALVFVSTETITFEFPEEQAIGKTIVNLKNHATVRAMLDNDDTIISQAFFTFLETNIAGKIEEYFNLERWTGILQFSRILDRDLPGICKQDVDCVLTLNIAINPTDYFDIIRVEIRLLDKNDNAPQFPSDRIEASVSESSSAGVILPVVAATDPDSPANGIQRYELSAPDKFRLDETWNSDNTVDLKLMLTSLLDREEVDHYPLIISAIDGGNPPKTGTVNIDIYVTDENDNVPQFDQAVYERSIRENLELETPIVTVHAADEDSGDNGRVSYAFNRKSQGQYGHLFTIDADTGEIRLIQPLDYEDVDFVSLTVIARDHGETPKPVYCTVQITIIDINDHAPDIQLETRGDRSDGVTLTEHSPADTFVVHASIRDPDSGDAGRVDCEMNEETHFRLQKQMEKEYTIFTTMELDREVRSRYSLILDCWDHGRPAETSTILIDVRIEDVNDHAPVFSQPEYVRMMPENNPVHASVIQVQARDDDNGPNGEITYMLDEDAGDKFHIDPVTGLITVVDSLDHEDVPFWQFHVTAKDGADQFRHAKALISLTVTDIDDEPPEFQQEKYIFSVQENLQETEIGRVVAIDEDGPPYNNFTYYLDGSEHNLKLFRIDPHTGAIMTKTTLDRESWKIYHMIAYAQSDSNPPKTDSAAVEIFVTDTNDNTPLITFPKNGNETVHISNTIEVGQEVAQIEASDPDLDDNGRLTYVISEQGESREFQIDPNTGSIRVKESLQEYDSAVFRLVIMVEDRGIPKKISVTTLTIMVTKRNETYERAVADDSGSNITTSPSHIHIIIGVVAGCVLISIILVVAIVMMKKRHKKPVKKNATLHFWSENGMDKEKGHGNGAVVTPGGNKLSMGDISLTVKTDVMKQPQLQLGKDDSDSGCADVSHTESQGSSEDPDGSLQKHHSGSSTGSYPRSPPRRMDSFSNWLHSESYHLNQKGNVYRVSEQNRPSPTSPSTTNTLNAKKTVRFSEPQGGGGGDGGYLGEPTLPPPPPELSSTSGGYYGPQQGGYYGDSMEHGGEVPHHYEADGTIVIVPEKSAFSTFHQPANDGSLV